MLNKEEIEQMAIQAKQKLQKQSENNLVEDDIYKEFRDNEELVNSDNYPQIRNKPTEDEYEQYEKINNMPYDDYEMPEYSIESENIVLFENGPNKALLDSWKKQWDGYGIYVVEISDIKFVFRTLNRFEYKQIVALQNIDALQREELICETVTLWPQFFNWEQMALGKAGIPSTFAEVIMNKSGFTKEYSIQVL